MQVALELRDRLLVNAGYAPVGLDPQPGLPNGPLRDLKRLRLRPRSPGPSHPKAVDRQQARTTCPLRSGPITGPSPLRSASFHPRRSRRAHPAPVERDAPPPALVDEAQVERVCPVGQRLGSFCAELDRVRNRSVLTPPAWTRRRSPQRTGGSTPGWPPRRAQRRVLGRPRAAPPRESEGRNCYPGLLSGAGRWGGRGGWARRVVWQRRVRSTASTIARSSPGPQSITSRCESRLKMRSLPAPAGDAVVARARVDAVISGTAEQAVVARAAEEAVAPPPPWRPGRRRRRGIRSRPVPPRITSARACRRAGWSRRFRRSRRPGRRRERRGRYGR